MKKQFLTLTIICSSLTATANATLIAYEGFDYTAGTTLNAAAAANGGSGWKAAWGTSTPGTTGTFSVVASSLSYSTLQTSGGSLSVAGVGTTTALGYRDLAAARGTDGTSTWISVLGYGTTPTSLLNNGTGLGAGGSATMVRAVNMAFHDTSSTTTPATAAGAERITFGEGTRNTSPGTIIDTDTWGILVGGGVANANTVWTDDTFTAPTFAVMRIDHGAGNVDTAWLWINPALGTEPSTSTADATTTGNFTFDRIRPFAGGGATATTSSTTPGSGFWDELRIGENFTDIAPIPEPSSALCLAGLALLGRRRRA